MRRTGDVLGFFDNHHIHKVTVDTSNLATKTELAAAAPIMELVGDTVKSTAAVSTYAGIDSVCIGKEIGSYGGGTTHAPRCVMIGKQAGQTHTGGNDSVGVGYRAGQTTNQIETVSIGSNSGANCGRRSTQVGKSAGGQSGEGAVSLGYGAYAKGDNSIVINASADNLIKTDASRFHVKPIRCVGTSVTSGLMQYDNSSSEVSFTQEIGFGVTFNGNVDVTGGKEVIVTAGGNSDKGFRLKSGTNGANHCGFLQEQNNAGVFEVRGGSQSTFNSSVRIYLDGRNGGGWASWGWFIISDDRVKSYEQPVTDAVDTLSLCQPKKYKKHPGHIIDADDETPDLTDVQWHEEYGLIAQELEAVGLNHFVRENPGDTTKSVAYTEFVPILIQAVKELSARVAALEGV